MLAGKRWRRGLFVAGLLGVVIVLAVVFSPRERLLLQRATLIVHLDDQTDFLGWFSGHEVLLTHLTNKPQPSLLFIRHDLRTGRENPLPALTLLFHKSGGYDVQISPDGRWILWSTENRVEGAALDGSHHFEALETPGDIRWMPDSHHWIALLRDGNEYVASVKVHSIDNPRSIQTLRLTPPIYIFLQISTFMWLAVTVTPQAHLLALTGDVDLSWSPGSNVRESSVTKISEFDLHAPARLPRTFSLRAPIDAEPPDEVAFSPQGNRIAWLRKSVSKPPVIFRWLHRLFPRFKVSVQPMTTLWVSHLDGSHMREIGHIARKLGVRPYKIQWTPDGKRLSFYYKEGLYTVPAD